MSRSGNTLLTFVMIIGMVLWGLSWPNGKILGDYTSVPVLMVWRFLIAALAMLIVLIFARSEIRIRGTGIVYVIVSSLLLALYNHFYFTGTHLGAAGAGGVLVTTLNPVLTFILVSLVYWKRPKRIAVMGIMLGIIGGTILLNIWQHGLATVRHSGNQYFVFCAATWALLTLISARISTHMSSLTYSFWVYLGSFVIALLLNGSNGLLEVFHYDLWFWANLLSISVGAMAFATTAYFIAASRLGSERASAFIFMVPLSAMVFSMLILDEKLQLNVLFGGILSIIAVYLINASNKYAGS